MDMSDLKRIGATIVIDGQPYQVVESQQARTSMSKSFVRTRLKNLINGSMLEKTFNNNDKLEEADLERFYAGFLYQDPNGVYFMNNKTYEQFSLGKDVVGNKINFLKEGVEVNVLNFEGRPVNIEMPVKLSFKVTETVAGAKGDTAQGRVMKPATIETGYELNVPIFINEGDTILVNTENGEYLERVN